MLMFEEFVETVATVTGELIADVPMVDDTIRYVCQTDSYCIEYNGTWRASTGDDFWSEANDLETALVLLQ